MTNVKKRKRRSRYRKRKWVYMVREGQIVRVLKVRLKELYRGRKYG